MVMDGGDIDALSEILIRLPAKSLFRFKSVSKHWLSLISSPHFCRRLARRNPGFLLAVPGQPYSFDICFVSLNGNPSVTAPPPFKSVIARQGICRILQSCNGLLLCHNLGKTKNFVFNPTTRQYLMLPQLIDIARSSILSINLAFDPLKSPYYKVVSVRSIDKDDYTSRVHYQIEIYSNEFGIWRNSGDTFTVPNTSMFFYDGVFSNGVVHWISPLWDWIYFNVEEERLEIMPRLPFVGLCGKRWFRYFGESFGHLHLLEIVRSQTTQFKVYELEKDNSNWFSKFNVDLDPIVNAGPNGDSAFMVLSIVREEDDDESSLLLHIPGKIVSYKFKDKSFRKLHDLPPCSCNDGGVGLPRKRCSINVYQYIESIACVRTCSS